MSAQGQKVLGHAGHHVTGDDGCEARLGLGQPMTDFLEHSHGDGRVAVDEAAEVLVAEHAHAARFHRRGEVVRALAGEEGRLADEVAWPQHSQDVFAAFGIDARHLNGAGMDHEQLRDPGAGGVNLFTAIHGDRGGDSRDGQLVLIAQRPEQRHARCAQIVLNGPLLPPSWV